MEDGIAAVNVYYSYEICRAWQMSPFPLEGTLPRHPYHEPLTALVRSCRTMQRISSRVQRRSGAREARRTQSPRSPTTSSSSPPPSSPSSSTSSSSSTAAWALQAASGWAIEPTRTPAKGVFLISHPLVGLGLDHPSSIFHRSVVLLVDHSDRLSYGLIVNKDRDVTLRDVVSPGALPQASDLMACFTDNPVRTGGPVMPCFSWLHQHESVGGVPLNDGPVGKQVSA